MDNLRFIDFFAEEASRMYKELHIKTMREYRDIYTQEEEVYKNSPDYKRIKNKEYWSRPKAEILQEQLEEEKAKLGYWVPHIAPSDTHITYQKKAMRDSSNTSNYETPTGFNPSISAEEFFENQKNRILAMTQNPIITSIVKDFAYEKFRWERTEDFELVCIDFVAANQDAACDFLEELESIDSNIGFKRKLAFLSNPFCNHFVKPSPIVINDCIVKAKILEQHKNAEFKIDVLNHKEQICILGKKVGDEFALPDMNSTYLIEEILSWKTN